MNKQVFFLLTVLLVSGSVIAGKKSKNERKRDGFAARQVLTAVVGSQSSLASSVDEKDYLEISENPNHSLPLDIDYAKKGKRALKKELENKEHQSRAAASFRKGRS